MESLGVLLREDIVALFERHGVLSRAELESRYHIYLEKFAKQINIEAGVMLDMVRRFVIPAVSSYAGRLARDASSLAAIGARSAPQEKLASGLCELLSGACDEADRLEAALGEAQASASELARAGAFRDGVAPRMARLRDKVDALERLCAKEAWPFPTYEDLLFKL